MNNRDSPPTVRSSRPKDNPASPSNLTPIGPSTRPAAKATLTPAQEQKFWVDYYRTRDESPDDLRETVGLLNAEKKFGVVRAAITGYLTHHNDRAEPWMYAALALAIRLDKGSEAEVKTMLGYAADLAVKSRNPNFLVSVADQMFLMDVTDRVGPLLDQANELIPHRGEPIVMSVNLAAKTHDPKRMADSVEKLLAQGWPDMDDAVRRNARKQVETLARLLREEARADEADELTGRLTASEARDVFVRLTWVGDADLDLVVDEPLGATARYRTPRTVFGGSLVKNGYGKHAEEVYVCPRGFDGTYTVHIETVYNNPDKPALTATLEVITHDGGPDEKKESHTVRVGKTIEPIKVVLKGGRRKTALPFISPAAQTSGEVLSAARRAAAKTKADKAAVETAKGAKKGSGVEKPKAAVPLR